MLILASASPRRQELLRNAGIEITVQPAHVNEDLMPGEDPVSYVRRLARDKSRAVWNALPPTLGHRASTYVLGADTTVVIDHHILAKPENVDDAKRMLRLLSGRTHEVLTGVHLAGAGIDDTRSESTRVTFARLTEHDIDMYAAHGEPMDKAGGYAIQGIASRWIPRIEGCYFNVVGLPVPLVWRMLSEHGVL